MDDNSMIILLIVLLVISWIISALAFLRLKRIKHKLAGIEEILAEVQGGNGNRKILAGTQDVMVPLVYRLNEIVYAYEEKLLSLKKADETNKQLIPLLSICQKAYISGYPQTPAFSMPKCPHPLFWDRPKVLYTFWDSFTAYLRLGRTEEQQNFYGSGEKNKPPYCL